MYRNTILIATYLCLIGSAAVAADGTYTFSAGETKKVYDFYNMRGEVCLDASGPAEARWLHTGEKSDWYPVTSRCFAIEKKLDGELEVHNTSDKPITVRVTENAKAANPLETVENFFKTVAGGEKSVPNDAMKKGKKCVSSWKDLEKCVQ